MMCASNSKILSWACTQCVSKSLLKKKSLLFLVSLASPSIELEFVSTNMGQGFSAQSNQKRVWYTRIAQFEPFPAMVQSVRNMRHRLLHHTWYSSASRSFQVLRDCNYHCRRKQRLSCTQVVYTSALGFV